MNMLKFEDYFQYKKDEEYTITVFFDNLIRRDFLTILGRMANGTSSMLCDNVGYELPENEDEPTDYIKIWDMCGENEYSYNLSYEKFIEFLEISAKIWLNNNNKSSDGEDKKIIDSCLNELRKRYLNLE